MLKEVLTITESRSYDNAGNDGGEACNEAIILSVIFYIQRHSYYRSSARRWTCIQYVYFDSDKSLSLASAP